MGASVYKMSPVPEIGQSIDSIDSSTPGHLETLADLDGKEDAEVAHLLWQPNDGNKIVTISTDSQIDVWDFSSSGKIQNISHCGPIMKVHNQVTTSNWSPHHGTNQVAVAMETNLQIVDLRSLNKGAILGIENAHSEPVRDLDFNPNRQYYLATCGDDGFTKFWDIRNVHSPVLSRQDHYHWYGSLISIHFH